MASYDAIVIGGGVIGTSITYHLARLGMTKVALIERDQIGNGTTAQSSCILRTHYSVPENVTLARERSWAVFRDFSGYLDDAEASCGLVPCGLPHRGARRRSGSEEALKASLATQRGQGIRADEIDAAQARALLPHRGAVGRDSRRHRPRTRGRLCRRLPRHDGLCPCLPAAWAPR